MKRFTIFLLAILFSIGLLLGILVINMMLVTKRSLREQEYFDKWSEGNNKSLIDPKTVRHLPELTLSMIQRFQKGIQYPTISYDTHSMANNTQREPFEQLIDHLVKSFPRIHSNKTSSLIHWQRVNSYSLLYIIHGSDPKFKPALFLAHLDVVPIGDQIWSVKPFHGVLKTNDGVEIDGETALKEKNSTYLYGRGVIDDKQAVFALLEAVEYILSMQETLNFRPARTILLAFGHDEEVGGVNGAGHIRTRLEQLGYSDVEYVLDEGTMVLDHALKYLERPVALVGTSEKGFATIRLNVTLKDDPSSPLASHASMPLSDGSVIILLAKALLRLHDNPLPSRFNSMEDSRNGVVKMLETVSPYLPLWMRLFTTNMWLLAPLLSSQINHIDHALDSMTRTTNAFTMIHAGHKHNVLPNLASAFINHRIHTADSIASLMSHYEYLLGDKSWISAKVRNFVDITWELILVKQPSPNSIMDDEVFGILYAATKYIYPDALFSPATLMANTDCNHYLNMTEHVYRFNPLKLERLDLKRFHGVDERILLLSYEKLIQYYYVLLTNSDFTVTKYSDKKEFSSVKTEF